ncbi:MAG: DUF1684 domain-containing protein [Reichenbachiella sp.]
MKYTIRIVYLIVILLTNISIPSLAQPYEDSIMDFQKEMDAEFKSRKESPLEKKDLKKFKGLDFFVINPDLRFEAIFIRTTGELPFQMKTTTDRLPTYEKYGEALFEYEGKQYQLNIYQNHGLRVQEAYKDYLFIPFTDLTSGEESYGGGRYLDLRIPDKETITIDFNKAYNPYCAYNSKYSCPIPPKENDLPFKVKAGVQNFNYNQ